MGSYPCRSKPVKQRLNGILRPGIAEISNPDTGWRDGQPPTPGVYWVRLACSGIGLIRVNAGDLTAWPKGAQWKTAKVARPGIIR
jgi:hypothetical protein